MIAHQCLDEEIKKVKTRRTAMAIDPYAKHGKRYGGQGIVSPLRAHPPNGPSQIHKVGRERHRHGGIEVPALRWEMKGDVTEIRNAR